MAWDGNNMSLSKDSPRNYMYKNTVYLLDEISDKSCAYLIGDLYDYVINPQNFDTPLNFIIYTDLTETEKRLCFYRTNLGTPLSKTEHYRAICKCLPEIDEIAKNPLFDDISAITAREEVIVKTEIMMGENPHLGNDKETYITWATIKFTKEKMKKYTELYDKTDEIYQFYSTYCPDRVEYLCETTGIEKNKRTSKKNTLIKKPLKKTHLLTLIPIVAKNMEYDSKLFGLWLTKFFVDSLDTTSESYIYNDSCSGGSGNSVKTKARLAEMEASFEKFKKNPLTVEEVVGVLPKKEEKKEEGKDNKKEVEKDSKKIESKKTETKKTESKSTTSKDASVKKDSLTTKDSKSKIKEAKEVKEDKVVKDKKVSEKEATDKKADEKKAEDKKTIEKKTEDKKIEVSKPNGKTVEDKKVEPKEEKKTEDKKVENKEGVLSKPEDKKEEKKVIELSGSKNVKENKEVTKE